MNRHLRANNAHFLEEEQRGVSTEVLEDMGYRLEDALRAGSTAVVHELGITAGDSLEEQGKVLAEGIVASGQAQAVKPHQTGRSRSKGPRTAANLRHADERSDLKPFPWGSAE